MSLVNLQPSSKDSALAYVLYFSPYVIMTVLSSWNVLLSTRIISIDSIILEFET